MPDMTDSDSPAPKRPKRRSRIEPLGRRASSSKTRDRVRAGLLVEGGHVPTEISRVWQEAVRDGEFDADSAAAEILAADPGPSVDEALERRSAVLMRDLVMAPLVASGRRRGRSRVKSGSALLLSQLYLLLVWGGLFLAGVLLLRLRGVSMDGFLDRLLAVFH